VGRARILDTPLRVAHAQTHSPQAVADHHAPTSTSLPQAPCHSHYAPASLVILTPALADLLAASRLIIGAAVCLWRQGLPPIAPPP
jgi:hypothetical protein